MADKYYNPFQSNDVRVTKEFHQEFQRYCQSQGTVDIDLSPFPRMIDFWFLSLCVACQLELEPVDITKLDTVKIIDGSIFSSDPWRIDVLMLVAISQSDDLSIASKPRQMLSIASGLATAGIPKVLEMLKDGDAEPIWNLSDAIDTLIRLQSSG